MGLLNSIGSAMKNQWCSYDFADFALAGLIAGAPAIATPIVGDELAIAAGVTSALTRVRNASDPWCSRISQSPLPPSAEPPFSGGQCPKPYYIRLTISYRNFAGQLRQGESYNVGTSGLQGAITGVSTRLQQATFNSQTCIVIVNYSGGQFEQAITSSLRFPDAELSIDSIVPVPLDGIDNCGDPSAPPIPIPPQDSLDDIIDIPLLDDDGNPLLDDDGNPKFLPDIPIKFFPPCIGLDGIKIPFEVNTPVGKVCGRAGVGFNAIAMPSIEIVLCQSEKKAIQDDIFGNFKQSLPPQSLDSYFDLDDPIGDAIPNENDGIFTDDYDLDSPPIMGIFIKANPVNDAPETSIIFQDDPSPNLLIPDIGNVIFEYLVRDGESSYKSSFSERIKIQSTTQFVPCPSIHGAVNALVNFRPQWQGQYQIARRKSCCDACGGIDPNELPPIDENDRCG